MDDLSWWWSSSELTDLSLTVSVNEGDDTEHPTKRQKTSDGESCTPEAGSRTIKLHRFVVCDRCTMFRNMTETMGTQSAIPMKVTSVDELDAIEELFECIYNGGALDASSELGARLVRCGSRRVIVLAKLAEFVGADRCLDQLMVEIVPHVHDTGMLDLPDFVKVVQHRPCWPDVAQALQKLAAHLLQPFMDITSYPSWPPELETQFLQLPAKLIRIWAESNDVQCLSEEDVLLRLDAWVAANNRAATPDHRKQLAERVRVCKLSAFFLSYVLPKMAWMKTTMNENAPMLLHWTGLSRDQTFECRYAFKVAKPSVPPVQQLKQLCPSAPEAWLDLTPRASERRCIRIERPAERPKTISTRMSGLPIKVDIREPTHDVEIVVDLTGLPLTAAYQLHLVTFQDKRFTDVHLTCPSCNKVALKTSVPFNLFCV